MAKVRLDPLFEGFSGTLGNLVFKRTRDGQTIVAQRPQKSNARPSPAQQAQRERFKLAQAYAKAALADPDLGALYRQRADNEGTSAFALARQDYFDGKDLLSKESPDPEG